jgi:hypothetical protein
MKWEEIPCSCQYIYLLPEWYIFKSTLICEFQSGVQENLKGRDHLVVLGVDGRIAIKFEAEGQFVPVLN